MFGCPHMQCLCGAHWCYYCQRSIDQCDGGCDEGEPEDDEGEYESEVDEDDYREYTEAEVNAFNVLRRAAGVPSIAAVTMAGMLESSIANYVVEFRIERGTATAAERTMMSHGTAARIRLVDDRLVVLTATDPAPPNTNNAGLANPTLNTVPPAYPDTPQRSVDLALTAANLNRRAEELAAMSTGSPASTSIGNPPVTLPRPLSSNPAGAPSAIAAPALPPAAGDRIVNLDRGGGRRWAGGNFDFGEEPQDNGVTQVWSCSHDFEPFKLPPEDGFDHGDFTRMECNRCFEKVEAKKEPPKRGGGPKKRRRILTAGSGRLVGAISEAREESQEDAVVDSVPLDDEAFECKRCKVVVCMGCKSKYHKEGLDDDE